ncbi:GOLPH3/VPS74 family protein [Saccharomonospora xinjiangensis]|uniref:Phosphoprotein 3 (GPP34) n=1 Tax=Saccharomonospora xinjiangensis XJ-54 TaxID=882086 RepID=I0UYP9_9PSEU|nr:GPP34 family phosphoprotein [Saccharomonospora xinjiangensis]EID53002.1 phosphoprotein 3 (GPP34) [Saccharomonospora xinjiangensis XJ-54]
MLLAEEMLLVAFDPEAGSEVLVTSELRWGLAGAVLIDLVLLGRVGVSTKADGGRRGRIVVRDGTPTGHGVLDDVLLRLFNGLAGQPIVRVIRTLAGADLKLHLLDGLVERGILRRSERRVLKVLVTVRWLAANPWYREQVKARLHRVLVHGEQPDVRTVAQLRLPGRAALKYIVGHENVKTARRALKTIKAADEPTGDRRRLAVMAICDAARKEASRGE